jgi:hypothetical protein
LRANVDEPQRAPAQPSGGAAAGVIVLESTARKEAADGEPAAARQATAT